jgi:hypothetical protein
MGLLDDAIREHLDLKRRRGADPTEVERAEREALGPVRRNREAPAASEVEDDSVAGGLAYDQAADGEDWTYDEGDEQFDEVRAADDDADVPPLELSGRGDAPRGSRSERPSDFDDAAFGESAFEEPMFDDQPPVAPAPRFADSATGAETAEYDVEEAMSEEDASGEGEGDGDSDDMLEETPEFLQDTPDHDRLWFEQRPPKDFDFDG